jgi:aldehyde:ferredoxin oxidoreductase
MKAGYAGKILFVDLTQGNLQEESLAEEDVRRYLGGAGLNARLAYDLIPAGTDPLSPENLFIIGAGPLVGTSAPGAIKTIATTKGPLGGTIISSATGHFGHGMKAAGYDHVLIKGKSDSPVYLKIFDDVVELADAGHLWGKDVYETTDALQEELGPCTVAAIGPAGENRVSFSLVLVDKQATWNVGGYGAVLGSKNLKAVVTHRKGRTQVADAEGFGKLAGECLDRFNAYPFRDQWRHFGVLMAWDAFVHKGFPTDNFDRVYPEEEARKVFGPDAYLSQIHKGPFSCPGCPLGCKAKLEVKEGEFKGLKLRASAPIGAIEYLGMRSRFDNLGQVAKGLELCNRYGMDACMVSAMQEYLVDLYEKGLIDEKDCMDNVPRKGFGPTMELISKVAHREGIGDVLAQGWKATIEKIGRGHGEQAVQIKGLGASADPRTYLSTEGFGSFTSHKGSHALRAMSITFVPGRSPQALRRYGAGIGIPDYRMEEVFTGPEGYNIPRFLKWVEDYNTVLMAVGLCNRDAFLRVYDMAMVADLFRAATGLDMSAEEMLEAGERAWNVERAFNAREGFTRKDDRPPRKWTEEPLGFYGGSVSPLDGERIEKMLDEYYQERGWDVATGLPGADKLEALGIDEG